MMSCNDGRSQHWSNGPNHGAGGAFDQICTFNPENNVSTIRPHPLGRHAGPAFVATELWEKLLLTAPSATGRDHPAGRRRQHRPRGKFRPLHRDGMSHFSIQCSGHFTLPFTRRPLPRTFRGGTSSNQLAPHCSVWWTLALHRSCKRWTTPRTAAALTPPNFGLSGPGWPSVTGRWRGPPPATGRPNRSSDCHEWRGAGDERQRCVDHLCGGGEQSMCSVLGRRLSLVSQVKRVSSLFLYFCEKEEPTLYTRFPLSLAGDDTGVEEKGIVIRAAV